MSQATNIPAPPADFEGTQRYTIRPREKRSFHTVLDARKMLAHAVSSGAQSEVTYGRDSGDVVVTMKHPIADGHLKEVVRLVAKGPGLIARSLSREVFDASGTVVRNEQVPDFRHDELGLPESTYPEVALPFLLGWMPFDGQRRSVYAWINDRFIAKVYIEIEGRPSISLGGTTYDTIEIIMYPDLNDWIHLGAMLTRLVKPFSPKYRMWYTRQAPHRLVRFEGPYGPPGAPEVILEAAQTR
jgi:hypothetical protein